MKNAKTSLGSGKKKSDSDEPFLSSRTEHGAVSSKFIGQISYILDANTRTAQCDAIHV